MVRKLLGAVEPSATSANLDAFRRRRGDATGATATSKVVAAVDGVPRSADPGVVFAALARAVVSAGFSDWAARGLPGAPRGLLARAVVSAGFSDSCAVELTEGGGVPFRAVFPGDGGERAGTEEPGGVLAIGMHGSPGAGASSYAGVVTYMWARGHIIAAERSVAELLTRQATSIVEGERLAKLLAEAQDRASELTMRGIAGRTVDLAIGIVMHGHSIPESTAEQLLRHHARTRRIGLWEVADDVVRRGRLVLTPLGRDRSTRGVDRFPGPRLAVHGPDDGHGSGRDNQDPVVVPET